MTPFTHVSLPRKSIIFSSDLMLYLSRIASISSLLQFFKLYRSLSTPFQTTLIFELDQPCFDKSSLIAWLTVTILSAFSAVAHSKWETTPEPGPPLLPHSVLWT